MKKITLSFLALAAAVAFSPAAHARTTPPGWYAGAGVGGTFPTDADIRSAGGKVKVKNHGANLDAIANVGYAWPFGVRVEAQYLHNQYNVHKVDGAAGFGHIINNAVFANVLYDFDVDSMFTPYVGAGIGPDFVNIKNYGNGGYGFLHGDTIVAAYQGIAGVAAQLDRNWAVTADYRYISSWDPKVNYTGGGKGRTENASHNVILGVRYSFGAPEAAPPARTAEAPMVSPAPSQPVAAPVAEQNFTVFFDFDKSVLGPEAKRIVASAVQQFKKDGLARISITGHTDTVGTPEYNKRLSDRRATAVEEEIKKYGISPQHIAKRGVGENDLLIPTADGVREAQNRRAEILLAK